MSNAVYQIREPENARMFDYLPGSAERADLKAKVAELKQTELEIPLIIGGKEIKTGDTGKSGGHSGNWMTANSDKNYSGQRNQ